MFDIFKIGFITFTFIDLLDIAIVSFIIFKLYQVTRGTIAAQIFLGLMIVMILSFLAQAANFRALGWMLKLITDIWVIAFIVLFQPEIRRLLLLVGRSPFFNVFVHRGGSDTIDIVTDSAFDLAQFQHGALIVLVKSTGIRAVVETGIQLNSKVNKELLRTIFFPRTALHDGAVVINGDIIEAARCTLPLSNLTAIEGSNLGMRHRAGLGISETADVISVIVSEETGSISIAENGQIDIGISKETLRTRLRNSLQFNKEKGWKSVFEQLTGEKEE